MRTFPGSLGQGRRGDGRSTLFYGVHSTTQTAQKYPGTSNSPRAGQDPTYSHPAWDSLLGAM